jgi:hypothetical protein
MPKAPEGRPEKPADLLISRYLEVESSNVSGEGNLTLQTELGGIKLESFFPAAKAASALIK